MKPIIEVLDKIVDLLSHLHNAQLHSSTSLIESRSIQEIRSLLTQIKKEHGNNQDDNREIN
jgi:hypothetical protein